MMADTAAGAHRLSLRPDGTLHVDLDHIKASKSWIGHLTRVPNPTSIPPGTPSYVQKSVANRTPSAATLPYHHGNPTPEAIRAALHQLRIDIEQSIKDAIKEAFCPTPQQYTVPTTITTTATATTMPTTPQQTTTAPHHGHHDTAAPAPIIEIDPDVQCTIAYTAKAQVTTTATATPSTATTPTTMKTTTTTPTTRLIVSSTETYPPAIIPDSLLKPQPPQTPPPRPHLQHPQRQRNRRRRRRRCLRHG